MKKAMKSLKLNLLGVGIGTLGFLIPFGIYGITMIPSLNANPFPFLWLVGVLMILFVLLGFIISDIQIARWRRKNKEWDTILPEEIKDKAWRIRYPFYLAALILLVIFLFFEIWYWISGTYPLYGCA